MDSDITGWYTFAPYAKDTLYKIDKITEQTKALLDETEKLRATIKNVVFTYNDDGKIIKEVWLTDGIIHRDDGPAVVTYYDNNYVKSMEWYLNGKRRRNDRGPTIITRHSNGNIDQERWHYE
jgi:hypothetical protein